MNTQLIAWVHSQNSPRVVFHPANAADPCVAKLTVPNDPVENGAQRVINASEYQDGMHCFREWVLTDEAGKELFRRITATLTLQLTVANDPSGLGWQDISIMPGSTYTLTGTVVDGVASDTRPYTAYLDCNNAHWHHRPPSFMFR